MAGTSNITGLESIIYADNASFDGTERGGAINADMELWIGSSTLPHIRKGFIKSTDGTVTVSYDAPDIDLSVNSSSLFGWQTISTSQTLAANKGYICISPGDAMDLTLPATVGSVIGDKIEIILDGATFFTIRQSAGQQIRLGILETTLGVTGAIEGATQGDWIELIYQGGGRWNASAKSGNFIIF